MSEVGTFFSCYLLIVTLFYFPFAGGKVNKVHATVPGRHTGNYDKSRLSVVQEIFLSLHYNYMQ